MVPFGVCVYYLGENAYSSIPCIYGASFQELSFYNAVVGPYFNLTFLTTKVFCANFVFEIVIILFYYFYAIKTCNEKFVSAVKKVCQPRLVLIRQFNSRFKFVNWENNCLLLYILCQIVEQIFASFWKIIIFLMTCKNNKNI